MILTLTVNPAIDHTVTVDRLVFEDRAYIVSTGECAGGRGINASHVIHSFGGQTAAIVTSGGSAGARFEQFLKSYGYPVEIVPIQNSIRTNLAITDKHGLTVKLNEFGPLIDRSELERLENVVRAKMEGASWLMLCGSLPPGVPPTFYATLIQIARRKKVKTFLDTDGDPLREGVEAHPTVVKPNQQEAERLLNTALITRAHFVDAVHRIHTIGAESVLLSLGSRGAVGLSGGRTFEALPPRINVVCPIAAGDAMAAAFVWAMRRKSDFEDAVRWGIAAGTASAQLPGLSFASLEQTKKIYKDVEVRRA